MSEGEGREASERGVQLNTERERERDAGGGNDGLTEQHNGEVGSVVMDEAPPSCTDPTRRCSRLWILVCLLEI